MKVRYLIPIVALVLIFGFALACSETSTETEKVEEADEVVEEEAIEEPVEEEIIEEEVAEEEITPEEEEVEIPQVDIEPIELSGSGATSTDFFDITGGLTIFEFSNTGDSNFIAYILDEEGNELELLVNEIGSISGKKAMYLLPGRYFINVEHGNNWKYTILQPRSFESKTIPYTFTGNSADISDLILIDGLIEINYSHSGSGNFIVYILNKNGGQIDLLVNEIGAISGSTTFKGDDKSYFISVELADGNYEIEVDYK